MAATWLARAPRAAHQHVAPVQQLPRRPVGLAPDDDGESSTRRDVLPPSLGRGQSRRPYFEVLVVAAGESLDVAGAARGVPAPAPRRGRLRLRARRGRQLRGRRPRRDPQLQPAGRRDLSTASRYPSQLRRAGPARDPRAARAGRGRERTPTSARSLARVLRALPPRARRLPGHRPRRRRSSRAPTRPRASAACSTASRS